MKQAFLNKISNIPVKPENRNIMKRIKKEKLLYIMLIPGILYFLVFKYLPMWGIIIAFKDYQPFLGIFGSKWVGLKHFYRFFTEPTFWMLFKNTLVIAVYTLVFYFPFPIIVALMLNEVGRSYFKRFVQTLIYIPHFMSWVIVAGLSYVLFTTEGGIVNNAIAALGLEKINFLLSASWFRPMIILQVLWKETGWATILFLAALSGVDPQLYEAAHIDGANRWKLMLNVTLPAISSTIVILLILRLAHFLDTGFEQIFLMLNPMNREVGEIFDTFVYRVGIIQGQYSYSTAVGLFKSTVGLVLVLASDYVAKKFGEEGII